MGAILVADDEELVLKLVARILSSAGYKVMTARNGLEAVALFRSYPDAIDLVLTDITMPLLDGLQVVQRVKETRPDAKVVCMTGAVDAPCPTDIIFIRKPFRPDQLLETVAAQLAK